MANSKAKMVVAQVPGQRIFEVPKDGIRLGDVEGYRSEYTYVVNGQLADADTIVTPGSMIVATPGHDNG